MSISYRKTQNKMTGSKNYNKWYGQAVILGTVSTADLAEEISHSTTVTYADIKAVLDEVSVTIKRHILNSQSVHVDGLGSFRPSIHSQLVDKAEDFDASKIKGYRIIFTPERSIVGRVTNTDGITKKVYGAKLLQGANVKELVSGNVKSVKPADSTGDAGNTGK